MPLMLVCGLNMGLSRRWTIYEEQIASPVDSPSHQGGFVVDVLERLRVGEVRVRSRGPEVVPEATPFNQVVRRVAQSSETLFPVVDASGRLTGIFSLRDIRLALLGTANLGPLVIAAVIAHRPALTVTTEDDLHTALKRMPELRGYPDWN